MKYDYFIIGNSIAAVGCIEGIRSNDKKGSICVVTDENYKVYGRPLISYLLWNKTTEENMLRYRPENFYSENRAELITGVRAEKIDPEKKTVELSDGRSFGYGKLLAATGSSPFVPPMKGMDKIEKCFNFMTLDDAKAIDKAVDGKSRVLIVGAGLIGLKCAEGISDKVGSIKVVDLADRILPSILDKKGSEIVRKHIESHGVEFYLNNSVQEFKDGIATLKDGTQIDYDAVVIAVGVRPNVSLIAEAGGEVARGIVTDLRCETTLKDIYAAGDCAESLNSITGERQVLALLPNAYMQGHAAGENMSGGNVLYDNAIPLNSIGFWGLHVITAGDYNGEETVKADGSKYKKLVTAGNHLRGFILIGDIERAGIYTRLVREKIPLDEIDFEAIAERPAEMAFSRAVRKVDLGGISYEN